MVLTVQPFLVRYHADTDESIPSAQAFDEFMRGCRNVNGACHTEMDSNRSDDSISAHHTWHTRERDTSRTLSGRRRERSFHSAIPHTHTDTAQFQTSTIRWLMTGSGKISSVLGEQKSFVDCICTFFSARCYRQADRSETIRLRPMPDASISPISASIFQRTQRSEARQVCVSTLQVPARLSCC